MYVKDAWPLASVSTTTGASLTVAPVTQNRTGAPLGLADLETTVAVTVCFCPNVVVACFGVSVSCSDGTGTSLRHEVPSPKNRSIETHLSPTYGSGSSPGLGAVY